MTILSALLFIILAAVRISAPLVLGALGGLYSEKSGVVNIAIEGLMLIGAFAAVVVSWLTGNPWLGILGAIAAGMTFALIHAVIAIRFKGNQTISGTAINMISSALTIYLMRMIFNTEGLSPSVKKLPQWGIGNFSFNPVVYFAFALVAVTWFVIYKTKLGLHIWAVGEHPAAADTIGINVEKIRYLGVVVSGALAGLAGACLSIGDGSSFQRNMTSGRGFMALAILIIGKWNPIGVLIAAFLFGLVDAFQISISSVVNIPSQFIAMIPYLVTLLALAGFMGKSVPPAASGKPYMKSSR